MEKEFNLSEKIENAWEGFEGHCRVENIKEFIKRLKIQLEYHYNAHKRYGEMTKETEMRFDDMKRDIDKLAGDKLT